MENNIEENETHQNYSKVVLLGMMIGGMLGAAIVLLYAPQSGKKTRTFIQEKSIQLRDQTNNLIKSEIEQVRFDSHKIMTDVQDKAVQIKQIGQEKIVKQLEQVSTALNAGITAVETT